MVILSWENELKKAKFSGPSPSQSRYPEQLLDALELSQAKDALKSINQHIEQIESGKGASPEYHLKEIQKIIDDLDDRFIEASKYIRRTDSKYTSNDRAKFSHEENFE